ncbi:MAG: hypothetical protein ABIH71_04545, partial [Candidatus Omnitrophota bacterium]
MRKIFIQIIILLFLACSFSAQAQVPCLINYQGRLTDSDGKLIEEKKEITFKIFNDLISENPLWSETYAEVDVRGGIFSVLLGTQTSLNDLLFNEAYFLEIIVDGETMGPRQQITSVGYAIKAKTADSADYANNAQTAKVADTIADATLLFPKGGIILCKNSCPAGYARVGALDGKFLVGGSSYNPAAGGSNTKTITTGNMPDHSHGMSHNHNIIVTRSGPLRGGLLMSDGVKAIEKSGLVSNYSGNT